MKEIEIFDPAMCCSTGVCGPSIDPELMRIATVINSLDKLNISSNISCFHSISFYSRTACLLIITSLCNSG
jgi:hypothetical protein